MDTYIGDRCFIATRALILGGVKIGNECIVGAGAVVTKDVPDYAIVAGSPARVIGDTRDLFRRRIEENGFDMTDYSYEKYFEGNNEQ